MTPVRTLERGYHTGGTGRAGQVRRVHVIRNDGGPLPGRNFRPGEQTWCGQTAGVHTASAPLIRDAPHELPEGLTWCPRCVGLLAAQVGMLDQVARLVGLAPG